jgi:hypothetical protein
MLSVIYALCLCPLFIERVCVEVVGMKCFAVITHLCQLSELSVACSAANEHGLASSCWFQVIREAEEWSYSHRLGSDSNSNA